MYRVMTAAFRVFAQPVQAEVYAKVTDEAAFRSLVSGKQLRYGMFGIYLMIGPDGIIGGRALGSPVIGIWGWQDGYFCRQMAWRGQEIGYNCQLVEAVAAQSLRFTSDKGFGPQAAFALE